MQKRIQKHSTPVLILAAFGIPLIYWAYLFLTSQTEIKWDSLDYQHLGEMITNQGWGEFFRTGPNREPLYPLLISFAMRIASALNANYLKVLAVLQFGLLFLTQFLTYKILQKLNLKPVICAITVFYIGISPALINCALSLYSEILIIALTPAAILIFNKIFSDFAKTTPKRIFADGILIGLTLITLTLVKGVFEVAGPAILISSLLILITKKSKDNKRFISLILVGLMTFWALLFAYKSANKYFNGNFTVTNRGAWAFYGFSARRVEPLSKDQLLASIAYIPGEGACKKFFTEDDCFFWSPYKSDEFGMGKLNELDAQGLTKENLDRELMRLSFEKIRTAPLQYSLLSGLEGFKIFFWESTQLSFVSYPSWLTALYNTGLFKDILRLIVAGLSFAGFIGGILLVIKNRKEKKNTESSVTLFFIVSMIFFYTAIYSFFILGTRYAVPVAPLFLCLTALLGQRFYKP